MDKLTVSVSPHLHSPVTTQKIMLDVIIALVPATIVGTVLFGLRSLLVVLVCVAAAVLSEFLFNIICKREQAISDLSAVVTGLILALNLPYSIPLWQAAVGSVFAIIVVKSLFGGIGQNFANPAATARIFMILSFSGTVAKAALPTIVDTVSTATPLSILKGTAEGVLPSVGNLLIGLRGGAIGETCVIALLLGGVYLIIKKVITWHTPVAFIMTVFVLSLIFSGSFNEAVVYTLSGGLFLGAIFMATDYSTTPTTLWGKVIFGFGCGFITVCIRFWGTYPEGVSFSILFMNIVTPYIEKLTAKKPFGGENK